MRTSAFLFAYDFVDEGYEAVLDNLSQRAGLTGFTMAAAYHHGRDVFPHSPVRKVRFLEGGTVYFRPDLDRYGALRPVASRLTEREDVLASAVERAKDRSMSAHAWTVYCHNTRLGTDHPEYTIHNAFGDPYLSDLCPSHPEVRAYARHLTADIAERGVASIVAESLHFGLFQHGHHHERYFVDFGAVAYYLFGLCFCEHCLAAAQRAGVDGERVRAHVIERLEEIFDGGPPLHADELVESGFRGMAGGEMGGFLDRRAATVTSLVDDVATVAADRGVRFEFVDPSGAMKGYATGRPTGPPAAESAWMFGADIEAIGQRTDVMALAYAADPDRVRFDLGAYVGALGPASRLTAGIRPMVPDCDSVGNLTSKLETIAGVGADRADFYHYGFIPLPVLDRIRAALDAVA